MAVPANSPSRGFVVSKKKKAKHGPRRPYIMRRASADRPAINAERHPKDADAPREKPSPARRPNPATASCPPRNRVVQSSSFSVVIERRQAASVSERVGRDLQQRSRIRLPCVLSGVRRTANGRQITILNRVRQPFPPEKFLQTPGPHPGKGRRSPRTCLVSDRRGKPGIRFGRPLRASARLAEEFGVKVGLDHYTIAHRGLNPLAALEFVRALGLDGVQFLEPRSISPDLDPNSLDALRDRATELGMYLEIGVASPNPIRASRTAGRAVNANELAQELMRQLEAAARLGVSHVRAYVGDRHDRFRSDPPWQTHLDASMNVMKRLAPALRSLNLKLAIETHADVTVIELLRILERLGPEVAGVTLDTGNLLMRLEDPLRAAEQLAPLGLGDARQGRRARPNRARRLLAGATHRSGTGADPRDHRASLSKSARPESLDRVAPANLRPTDSRSRLARLLPRPSAVGNRIRRRLRRPLRTALQSRGWKPPKAGGHRSDPVGRARFGLDC